MRIIKYTSLLDDNRYPQLFMEKAVNYADFSFKHPESIVKMMNDVFQMDRQTEECFYELCFSTDMKLIGVFEVFRGTVNNTLANPREVFQKALLCGASLVVRCTTTHPGVYRQVRLM